MKWSNSTRKPSEASNKQKCSACSVFIRLTVDSETPSTFAAFCWLPTSCSCCKIFANDLRAIALASLETAAVPSSELTLMAYSFFFSNPVAGTSLLRVCAPVMRESSSLTFPTPHKRSALERQRITTKLRSAYGGNRLPSGEKRRTVNCLEIRNHQCAKRARVVGIYQRKTRRHIRSSHLFQPAFGRLLGGIPNRERPHRWMARRSERRWIRHSFQSLGPCRLIGMVFSPNVRARYGWRINFVKRNLQTTICRDLDQSSSYFLRDALPLFVVRNVSLRNPKLRCQSSLCHPQPFAN
ncbi:MAG: hypothetical protein GAK35_02628 [Herbaspirillum frisingense]|uniref:Uncharacterized protein n=1 Tax=Herbaspirillum frisingense TaxID=92645 RepID=A0A7V8FVR0_9BURK|nr:MAG: hypothetical protein GAK35_02628 [Herbaspirillum frisingense]